jgi:6-phosphogluconate dehydrogenase
MRVAMAGLGRMGMNMARRLLQGGHEVVAFNRTSAKTDELALEGAAPAYSLGETVEKLKPPRIIWLMLPAGQVVEEHLKGLEKMLSAGDTVVDGGNTDYRDDIERSGVLRQKGIRFMDVGVSGGVWGLEKGYCLMAGGERETFDLLEPLFKTLAPEKGYLHCGPAGAGHFVKMVHNGIEYGMMQAYGEGFEILDASPYAGSLDYADLARLWNRGSVIRSWLLELAEAAFSKDRKLEQIGGNIEDSGEGRWAVREAVDMGVSAPVIALSLMRRFSTQRSRDAFSDRVVAALRREFGGHAVAAPSPDK